MMGNIQDGVASDGVGVGADGSATEAALSGWREGGLWDNCTVTTDGGTLAQKQEMNPG